VGIGSSGQNLEAVSAGPWLSCLCPFQVQWPAQSPVLRRSASGDLGILRRNPRLIASRGDFQVVGSEGNVFPLL
jgi:hypothetical protein